MQKQNETKKVKAINPLTVGIALGAAAGVLLTNKKNRDKVTHLWKKAMQWANKANETVAEQTENVVHTVKTQVDDVIDLEDSKKPKTSQTRTTRSAN